MNENGHRKRRIPRRNCWWVCAVEHESGRPIVQGPHLDESEARQWGFEHLKGNDFEVLMFPTVDKTSARDMYKNVLVERSNQLPVVFKRAKYKV